MTTLPRILLAQAAADYLGAGGTPEGAILAVAEVTAGDSPILPPRLLAREACRATSREVVAETCDMGATTVHRWITGQQHPDAQALADLRRLCLQRAVQLASAARSEVVT